MPIPNPSFTFEQNFLGISFTDKSGEKPNVWNWDFGDGNSSTEQHPQHIYTSSGTYTVTFTAGNTEGSNFITQTLYLKDQINYGYTILEIIATERPIGIAADPIFELQRQKYWQLHLQTLITPNIADPFVFTEDQWPNLVNILIAKLVVHDIVMKSAKEALAGAISSGSTTTTSGGGIKSIETGPSKVEWYDVSSTMSQIFKPGGAGNKSIFDTLNDDICNIASRYRIKLPMCLALSQNTIIPQKVGRSEDRYLSETLRKYGWGNLS